MLAAVRVSETLIDVETQDTMGPSGGGGAAPSSSKLNLTSPASFFAHITHFLQSRTVCLSFTGTHFKPTPVMSALSFKDFVHIGEVSIWNLVNILNILYLASKRTIDKMKWKLAYLNRTMAQKNKY